MPRFSRELETLPKIPIYKKILLIVLVVTAALAAVVLVGPMLATMFSGSQNSDYTVVTFALYQTVPYRQGGVDYEFSYLAAGPGNILQVSSEGKTESYSAFAGAAYKPFGLDVKIVSANEFIVLHVAAA